MRQSLVSSNISKLSPDLIKCIRLDASLDAFRVGEFLRGIGIISRTQGNSPVRFPLFFLLELAAILRLEYWEISGFHQHQNAGLPSADKAADHLIKMINKSGGAKSGNESSLLNRVLEFFIGNFSWNAQALLKADVILTLENEDTVLDLIADFCWRHRHSGNEKRG